MTDPTLRIAWGPSAGVVALALMLGAIGGWGGRGAWDGRPAGTPPGVHLDPKLPLIGVVHVLDLDWPPSVAARSYARGRADQLAADRAAAPRAVAAQAASTTKIAAADAAAQAKIRIVYRTLIREVPTYVSPEADRRAVVPVGFVRLHDAAALGQPLSDATAPGDRPAGADGVPAAAASAAEAAGLDADSGLKLSDVAATVVSNYQTCQATRRQLIDLQQWERERAAIAAAARP